MYLKTSLKGLFESFCYFGLESYFGLEMWLERLSVQKYIK